MKRGLYVVVAIALVSTVRDAQALRDETASFSTDKEPAKVFIDGVFVGNTPLVLPFSCKQVGDRRYRIEREGCDSRGERGF